MPHISMSEVAVLREAYLLLVLETLVFFFCEIALRSQMMSFVSLMSVGSEYIFSTVKEAG